MDSGVQMIPNKVRKAILFWLQHIGEDIQCWNTTVQHLCVPQQASGSGSCGVIALNTVEHTINPATERWTNARSAYHRIRYLQYITGQCEPSKQGSLHAPLPNNMEFELRNAIERECSTARSEENNNADTDQRQIAAVVREIEHDNMDENLATSCASKSVVILESEKGHNDECNGKFTAILVGGSDSRCPTMSETEYDIDKNEKSTAVLVSKSNNDGLTGGVEDENSNGLTNISNDSNKEGSKTAGYSDGDKVLREASGRWVPTRHYKFETLESAEDMITRWATKEGFNIRRGQRKQGKEAKNFRLKTTLVF
ncbi:hypothetical protein BGX21_006436 [Mortierella sp. AD011]|nr:hypothetical protein BGX21_006436 [Mortierella sp. AD011]